MRTVEAVTVKPWCCSRRTEAAVYAVLRRRGRSPSSIWVSDSVVEVLDVVILSFSRLRELGRLRAALAPDLVVETSEELAEHGPESARPSIPSTAVTILPVGDGRSSPLARRMNRAGVVPPLAPTAPAAPPALWGKLHLGSVEAAAGRRPPPLPKPLAPPAPPALVTSRRTGSRWRRLG